MRVSKAYAVIATRDRKAGNVSVDRSRTVRIYYRAISVAHTTVSLGPNSRNHGNICNLTTIEPVHILCHC